MSHHVKPMIDGDRIYLEFSCTEEPGADCKLRCPVDPSDLYRCEAYNVERDENGDAWHVGFYFNFQTLEEFDGRLHKMIPTDVCNILEWDCLDECYAGNTGPLREGDVVFSFNGDEYEWDYAKVDTPPPAA